MRGEYGGGSWGGDDGGSGGWPVSPPPTVAWASSLWLGKMFDITSTPLPDSSVSVSSSVENGIDATVASISAGSIIHDRELAHHNYQRQDGIDYRENRRQDDDCQTDVEKIKSSVITLLYELTAIKHHCDQKSHQCETQEHSGLVRLSPSITQRYHWALIKDAVCFVFFVFFPRAFWFVLFFFLFLRFSSLSCICFTFVLSFVCFLLLSFLSFSLFLRLFVCFVIAVSFFSF